MRSRSKSVTHAIPRTLMPSGTWGYAAVSQMLRRSGVLSGAKVESILAVGVKSRTTLVRTNTGRTLFLKFSPTPGANRELWFYQHLGSPDASSHLRQLAVKLEAFDQQTNVLMIEGLVDYTTLNEHIRRSAFSDNHFFAVIAWSIGRLHVQTPRLHGCLDCPCELPSTEPPTVESYAHSAGIDYGTFLAVVQSVRGELEDLRSNWRPQSFIHGDLSGENILLPLSAAKDPIVKLVDWEFCGWGDPLWDIGTLLGQFLFQWLQSLQPIGSANLGDLLSATQIKQQDLLSALSSTWLNYCGGRGESSDMDSLRKALRYAGVFLLNRGFAWVSCHGILNTSSYLALQVARTILTDTDTIMTALFPGVASTGYMRAGS